MESGSSHMMNQLAERLDAVARDHQGRVETGY
jgi:hypothetical protein